MEEGLRSYMASCYHGVDNEEISRLTAELLSLSERPSLSDTVAYKYEPLEEGHIRLITLLPGRAHDQIRLKLQHVDFANPPPYCALSYVWGTPEPRCNVWIGDQTFEIGPNLYAALSQIRSKNAALIIWIDAVAINQSDNREKSKQIPQMATLYRRAERVIAWLGETEESAAVAFAFLDLWARWDRHGVELQRELTAELKFVIFPKYSITVIGECLRRFCRRPFFRRAWTWQEICTPADRPAIFCCGEDVILIDTVRDAFYSMLATLTRSEQGDLLGVAGEVMWTAIAHQQQPGDTISFTSTVAHMDRREASNVLDHIYAYRGMFSAPEGSYPDPDYDLPVHEVFTSYTRASIRLEKSLHIISRIRPGEAYWNIPSWAVKPPPLTSHWSYVGSEFESAVCATGDSLVVGLLESDDRNRCLPLRGTPVDSIVHHCCLERASLRKNLLAPEDHEHPWTFILQFLEVFHDHLTWGINLISTSNTTVNAMIECITYDEFYLSWATDQFFAAYALEANRRYVNSPWNKTELLHHTNALLDDNIEIPARDRLSRTSGSSDTSYASMAHWLEETIARYFIEHIENTLIGRQLAVTRSGYIALVPETACLGDEICLLFGGRTPFVLRRFDDAGGYAYPCW